LEKKPLLYGVIERVPLSNLRSEGLLYVLLYELLLGPNQKIRGGGALKRQIMKKESDLKSAVAQVKQQQGDTAIHAVSFPHYVGINTLQADPKEVMEMLNRSNSLLTHMFRICSSCRPPRRFINMLSSKRAR
jgi:hypothetical protein